MQIADFYGNIEFDKMNEITKKIKVELWKNFCTMGHPAEWDGLNYGGGKISQRFWEYFKTIELLELNQDSVLLDIGGGSPKTGAGFFAELLCQHIKKIIIMDPNINDIIEKKPHNVEFIKECADAGNLKNVLISDPRITHIVSVSVLEHMEPLVRGGIIKAINDYFKGDVFAATFEYHPKRSFFDHQLTSKTASDLFKEFTNFYLTELNSSPVWSDNAFINKKTEAGSYRFYRILPRRIQNMVSNLLDAEVSGWYPVSVKFERIIS